MARIILAEDDELIGEIICDQLMEAGHAVGWLKDGEQALAVIERKQPELVILDHMMPKLTGREVLREMRKQEALMGTPVLMLTAVDSSTDQSIAYYEGADDYITKPFDPDELVNRVELLIGKSRRYVAKLSH